MIPNVDPFSFTDPQRLHPLTIVLGPLRIARAWLIPIAIAVALGRGDARRMTGAGFVAAAVAIAVGRQTLEMIRIRWWLADGAFHLRSGILQVESKTVPLDRIQNVDVVEPWLPRLLGLAEVRVETAGTSNGNLVLSYVSREVASSLREQLTAATLDPASDAGIHQVLVRSSTRELLIAGATANRAGALAVLLAAVIGTVSDLGLDPPDVIAGIGRVSDLLTPAVWVVVLAVVLVAVGWAASIGGTILRFHAFTLEQHGTDLRRQHGLFSRATGVVPLSRVQAVRVDRPWLRRLVSRASVVAESAGSVSANTDTGSGVMAPILDDAAVPGLLERVIGFDGPFEDDLSAVSPLAIRRGFIKIALPPVILTAALAVFEPWASAALVPEIVLAYWWARARYRAIGYHFGADLVVARAGVLTRRTWLVPVAKIQSTVVRSSPFQRRLGLATLSIDTAGPGTSRVRVIDLQLTRAQTAAANLSRASSMTGLVSDGV